jgi:hypothetical protein
MTSPIPKATIKVAEAAFEQAMHDGRDPLEAGILAALPHLAPPAPPLPKGWRAVPVDNGPTIADTEIPPDMLQAGVETYDAAQRDLGENYVAGKTIDWDTHMIVTAIYRAMLAAAPEPPANSQRSLDGSEPMMTDEEISEFIKENGQPEDTFPYLRVPLSPAADPVKVQLVEALKGYEEWEADIVMNGDWSDDFPKLTEAQYDRMMELQEMRNAALSAAEAEENRNKG